MKKTLNTESLARAIVDDNSKLFGSMPLSIPSIAMLMARTKERVATPVETYLVMNEKMYRKLIALPDVEMLFDPHTRIDIIESGQMGTLLGMDIRVSELVEGELMYVVIQDKHDILTAMCSEMF